MSVPVVIGAGRQVFGEADRLRRHVPRPSASECPVALVPGRSGNFQRMDVVLVQHVDRRRCRRRRRARRQS